MDNGEFLKAQFQTIREEVKETKSRIFKIISLGIIVVPAAYFLSMTYKIDVILLAIPLLVMVVALLYLSENHALMRAGRYIRMIIEPQYKDILGWETWLEKKDEFDNRTVDKYLSYCFYIIFFIYFIGSVFMACVLAHEKYGILVCAIILGSYIVIGGWFLIFLIKNIKTTTTTKTENL